LDIGSVILVLFLSATKFLFAPGVSLGLFGYWETIVLTISGGWFGVLFFYFGSSALMRLGEKRREEKIARLKAEGKWVPKKKFTKMNKFIVRSKRNFGIIGISIVTPAIISIPIGSIILAKFYPNWKITIPVVFAFVVGWSFLITTFGHYIFEALGWK
jgi:hypothetical protein